MVELKDDDMEAVEGMIRFMYGIGYSRVRPDSPGTDPWSMDYNMKVYQAADKYMVSQLKEVAKAKFMDTVMESARKTRESMKLDAELSIIIRALYMPTKENKELCQIIARDLSYDMHFIIDIENLSSLLDEIPGFWCRRYSMLGE